MDLKIDPEFRSLIAPLRPDELQELEASLVRDGCREPLSVWETDGRFVLLDGHNRYDICQRLGIPYKTTAIPNLPSRDDARLWIEQNQIARRNLSEDQRAMIWESILDRRNALSRKERASKAGKAGGIGRPKNSSEDKMTSKLSAPKERIRAALAREAKLPEGKLKKAHALMKAKEELAKELAAKVRSGEMRLNVAWRQYLNRTWSRNGVAKQ